MLAEKSKFTIKRMARLLEVSRSGFYAWWNRTPSKQTIQRERIEQKVARFPGDSDEVSGSPKILADLLNDGEIISSETVAKVVRVAWLVSTRSPVTTPEEVQLRVPATCRAPVIVMVLLNRVVEPTYVPPPISSDLLTQPRGPRASCPQIDVRAYRCCFTREPLPVDHSDPRGQPTRIGVRSSMTC